MKPASKQQFRLKLVFYNELETLLAIPLNGVPSPAGHEAVGGMVRGKEDRRWHAERNQQTDQEYTFHDMMIPILDTSTAVVWSSVLVQA